jgi:hypothetical protein
VFQFHGGKLIAKVFVLILKLFILGPDPGPLVLSLLSLHFELGLLLASVLTEFDIRDTLPQHMIGTLDGLLDVLRPTTEEITQGRNSIGLLCGADIRQVIHQGGYQHLMLIILWCATRAGLQVVIQVVNVVVQWLILCRAEVRVSHHSSIYLNLN